MLDAGPLRNYLGVVADAILDANYDPSDADPSRGQPGEATGDIVRVRVGIGGQTAPPTFKSQLGLAQCWDAFEFEEGCRHQRRGKCQKDQDGCLDEREIRQDTERARGSHRSYIIWLSEIISLTRLPGDCGGFFVEIIQLLGGSCCNISEEVVLSCPGHHVVGPLLFSSP